MNKLSIKELMKNRKKKGFTLIELIIVIAIIAILAAMAIPKFGEIKETANKKTDLATAKNIATATATLIADGETVQNQEIKSGSKIADKLDGNVSPKYDSTKNKSFTVKIESGNIKVYYTNGDLVYPEVGSREETPNNPQ